MIGVPAWNNATIFAVLIGIVAFSMFMGRRARQDRPRGAGSWAGLVVLLVVLSAFFGLTTFRMRNVVEERHVSHNTIGHGIQTAREELDRGMQEIKASVGDKIDEAKQAVRDALGPKERDGKKKDRVELILGNPPSIPALPAHPNAPRVPVVFEVTITNFERSQNKEFVAEELYRKATQRVIDWVRENLPVRNVNLHGTLTRDFLKEKGVFEDPDIEGEAVPRPGGTTDTLFGGSVKVTLAPDLQNYLLNIGFEQLDRQLRDEKFMEQTTVLALVLVATVAAAAVGLMCYAHRTWRSPAALQ